MQRVTMAPLTRPAPGRVARTFPHVLLKCNLSSQTAQPSLRNSEGRSVELG